MPKKSKIHPRAAESITRGMEELAAMLHDGATEEQRFTVRTIELPREPSEYAPRQVRALRHSLHVSQALFASLLGVSTVLVQAWEQGKRKPNPMARRLLDEVRTNPNHWLAMLRSHAMSA
ncbi:MAG TPA: hypothetical protein VMD30_02590 [Tepidisphaeraceae bacterium]|nr:hypothetical protein [Tepidisphaeraceae bacterium]